MVRTPSITNAVDPEGQLIVRSHFTALTFWFPLSTGISSNLVAVLFPVGAIETCTGEIEEEEEEVVFMEVVVEFTRILLRNSLIPTWFTKLSILLFTGVFVVPTNAPETRTERETRSIAVVRVAESSVERVMVPSVPIDDPQKALLRVKTPPLQATVYIHGQRKRTILLLLFALATV